MARLIAAFVRHGDYHQMAGAPSAHQPFALNEAGERQAGAAARELGRVLKAHDWRLIPVLDSSRMLRAWQTAQIIADTLGPVLDADLRIESFDALAERGLGCAANLTVTRIEQVLRADPRFPDPPPGWKADSYYRLPLQGAESLLEAGSRLAAHVAVRMSELAAVEVADCVKLFVGHGAAFRHAAYHLGALRFEQIAGLSMYHGRPLFFEQGLDGRWSKLAGDWKIRGEREDYVD